MGFWRQAFGLEVPRLESSLETRAAGTSGGPVPPSRTPAARVVSVESSLGLSGVFRAIQILATSVGQLELTSYRRGQEVDPVPLVVTRPDVDRSRRSFLKRTTVNLAATGNAYWRVFRDPTG